MLRVMINNKEHPAEGIGDIDKLLATIERTDDLEILLTRGGQSLIALLNKNCGWLMYLPFPEAAGFSSRNPDRSEQASETEAFLLANGQADSYPKSWTVDRTEVFAAIVEFAKTSVRPRTIVWHDDITN